MNNNARYYREEAEKLYTKAYNETKELLRQIGDRCIVANCPFIASTISMADIITPINVIGVRLNDEGHICVYAYLDNYLYDCEAWDWPDERWVDIERSRLNKFCYPDLYEFVAENIDDTLTLEEANEKTDSLEDDDYPACGGYYEEDNT